MNIHNILSNWEIGKDVPVTEIKQTAWHVGENHVLKTGTKEEWLKNNINTCRVLSGAGVPVPEAVKTKAGDDYIIVDGTYYCLFTRLPGDTIHGDFEGDYLGRAYVLGMSLARLHEAFLKVEAEITCKDNDLCAELEGWVAAELEKSSETDVSAKQARSFAKEFKSTYHMLPRQIIHRDFHGRNLLFQDGKLCGYIDFDLSKKDARLFDLCYFALGVLSGCFTDIEKREKWLQIFSEIAEGYDSVCKLTAEEQEALPQMCYAIELIFIAYFSKTEAVSQCQLACDMAVWLQKNVEKLKHLKRKGNPEEMTAFFDKRAGGYECHMTSCFGLKAYEKGISALPSNNEPLKVIDIGCGTGLELQFLFNRLPNAHVTCLDLSENMLTVLKENYINRGGQLEILRGSYLEWRFPPDTYDIILAFNTLHHFTKEVKTEIYRNICTSLKNGGLFVEADYMVDAEDMEYALVRFNKHQSEGVKCGEYHIDIPFTVDVETGLMRDAGFSQVRVEYADIKKEGSFAVLTGRK